MFMNRYPGALNTSEKNIITNKFLRKYKIQHNATIISKNY